MAKKYEIHPKKPNLQKPNLGHPDTKMKALTYVLCTLGVKIRNYKVDFMTGGTKRRVRQ